LGHRRGVEVLDGAWYPAWQVNWEMMRLAGVVTFSVLPGQDGTPGAGSKGPSRLTSAHPETSGNLEGAANAAADGDHIVLGLRGGLDETAAKVGGRTLLKDPEWRATLQRGIADPSTKFTVSLDGMSGSSVYQQVMGAAGRGASGAGGATDWEMA